MYSLYDLSDLSWTLSGWTPNLWRLERSMELGETQQAEIAPIPAAVPGSVQQTLLAAKIIPDWNHGFNARLCEWVENRHWVFSTTIPSRYLLDQDIELFCEGLDYSGWVLWDGKIIGEFSGSHRPHVFCLPHGEMTREHSLSIIFDMPPRFLGQFGYTSHYSVGKPRFYYTWDWMPRIVQTAVTGKIWLRRRDCSNIKITEFSTGAVPGLSEGIIRLNGHISKTSCDDRIVITLWDRGSLLLQEHYNVDEFAKGISIENFQVDLWHPNGQGSRKLYTLNITLERNREKIDEIIHTIGFRSIRWRSCLNAPLDSTPWLCEVNGEPLFIQGVNWTPIRPNYADVSDDEYRVRLQQYRDIGINLIRVWGGASLERDILYRLCDDYGIMVWQEFPLCSSGIENLPPSDAQAMAEIYADAEYYIDRLAPHPSLIMWCGGNELQRGVNGGDVGCGYPCDCSESMLAKLAELVEKRDPSRRFVPSSASGPREFAEEENYGKGLHWDVHGPWKTDGALDENWRRYWNLDDSMLRSEVGSPGASPAELIREFAPQSDVQRSLWWNYPLTWWNEHDSFKLEHKREPESLDEYVRWSQSRQAEMLSYIAATCKCRFPICGGIIIWMGHDAFPCAANTSILDFYGKPKPAAIALQKIFTVENQPADDGKIA